MEGLKDRLKQLIDIKGVTAYQVSKETGVSESTISHVMTGKTRKMKIDTIRILSEYFNVSRFWLQSGIGEMNPETKKTQPRHPDSEDRLYHELIIEIERQRAVIEELRNALHILCRRELPPENKTSGGVEKRNSAV